MSPDEIRKAQQATLEAFTHDVLGVPPFEGSRLDRDSWESIGRFQAAMGQMDDAIAEGCRFAGIRYPGRVIDLRGVSALDQLDLIPLKDPTYVNPGYAAPEPMGQWDVNRLTPAEREP